MKRISILFLTISLLIMQTIFLAGCKTAEPQRHAMVALPERYEELHVKFEDMPEHGGLLLKYDEYRKLAINVQSMRSYEKQLEELLLSMNGEVE